jgi:excisionase family DNA binding protein
MASETRTRYLTADQVGLRLGFTGRTVRRWVRDGDLPAIKLGSARQSPLRVDADELEAWLEARHLERKP